MAYFNMRSEKTIGHGRTKVTLCSWPMGKEWIICIQNENAHIGAVAVGEYDAPSSRVSTSVITRSGHKDDTVARDAAYAVARATRRPVCVIAGIHVDNITAKEIEEIISNSSELVKQLLRESPPTE